MTEKEKIRAEIERRYNEYMAKDSELAAIRADECLGILSYIDSMQEESTIPDIVDEHYWEMLGEEPVSNKMGGINNALSQDILAMKSVDLEKEIEIYMGTNLEWDSDALRDPIESWGIKIARHFAAWQKEQDKQWLAENHKHIFAKGRESAEVWISADDDVNNAAEKTTRRFCKISLLSGDYLSLAEAQPQVNKESKLIAIKSFVCGAQWDRDKLMKQAVDGKVTGIGPNVNGEVYDKSQKRISATYTADNVPYCELGDKVKLIILKEN